jgi:hypothetical protein
MSSAKVCWLLKPKAAIGLRLSASCGYCYIDFWIDQRRLDSIGDDAHGFHRNPQGLQDQL